MWSCKQDMLISIVIFAVLFGIYVAGMRLWIHVLYSKYYDYAKSQYSDNYVKTFIDTPEKQMFGAELFRKLPTKIVDISEDASINRKIKQHNNLVMIYKITSVALLVLFFVVASIW